MQVAAEANRGTVPEAASSGELRPLVRLAVQVPAQPTLTLGEEFLDVSHRVGPTAAADRRHGHDHAPDRVDHDTEAPGPRGATEDVVERAAWQTSHGWGLGNRHPSMVSCRGHRGTVARWCHVALGLRRTLPGAPDAVVDQGGGAPFRAGIFP